MRGLIDKSYPIQVAYSSADVENISIHKLHSELNRLNLSSNYMTVDGKNYFDCLTRREK